MIVFNFFSLCLLRFSASESSVALDLLRDPTPSKSDRRSGRIRRLLADKGFLIDDGVDERELLRASFERGKTAMNRLSLTIAPTLRCNFRCTYCYQSGKGQAMTEGVVRAVVAMARERTPLNGALSVSWFGGEPLLELPIVESLTTSLKAICVEKKARYSASMITNGYLLSEDTARRLLASEVRRVQITMDGPPDIHDRRRVLRGGRPTFSAIIENIKKAPRELAISLRLNADKLNRGRIDEFLDILVREGLQRRVGFYIGQVQPYTEVCRDVTGDCLGDADYSYLSLQTLMQMADKGFGSKFLMPRSLDYACMADHQNSFVITPSGGLAKCWNDVGEPACEVGHLRRPATEAMKSRGREWADRDPFKLECRDCKVLPICMGGCAHRYLRRGELSCHPWKRSLDDALLVYYYFKEIEREGKIAAAFKDVVAAIEEAKASSTQG